MSKRIAVIGAGIGGLAVSLRLAISGIQVDVYEKNPQAGGKLSEIRNSGFRFDTGPSLFTMPEFLDELFQLSDINSENFFKYVPLEIITKYFYEDGLILNAYQKKEKFAKEVSEKTYSTEKEVLTFLERAKMLYEITSNVFLFSSLHKISNYFTLPFLKAYLKIHKIDAFSSMHSRNEKMIQDERLVQLFDRYATYNGSNPYIAPATLNVIAHLEHNIGAFFPEKGMYSIIQSILQSSEKYGVKFHYNSEVKEINIENSKVKGVLLSDGQIISYDHVIVNSDINYASKNLITNINLFPDAKNDEYSSSGIIFYWGISKEFPELELHNILFSKNYKEEFETIFSHKSIYHDPTVYIFISKKIVETDAPPSKENWFVMINTSADFGQDWKNLIQEARKNIIFKINKILKTDIEKLNEVEEIASPLTIAVRTLSYKGAIYGKKSNSKFAAFRRFPNLTKKVKG